MKIGLNDRCGHFRPADETVRKGRADRIAALETPPFRVWISACNVPYRESL